MVAAAQSQLESDVSAIVGDMSGVECRVVHGGRRKVLRALSQDADLLVIGAPRRSELTASSLFAHRLIHSAYCPAVVVPLVIADQPDRAGGARPGR